MRPPLTHLLTRGGEPPLELGLFPQTFWSPINKTPSPIIIAFPKASLQAAEFMLKTFLVS